MNLPEFRIRCSAIGQIMTNSRTKGQLSKTAQTYVDTWIKEQIYKRRKVITSKYFDKGNIVEDESIAFAGRVLNQKLKKNEKRYADHYLTGTPDVITDDYVIDVKNSWDCFTFPLFFENVPNKDYFYQAQGYMALTGHHHYKLIYTSIINAVYVFAMLSPNSSFSWAEFSFILSFTPTTHPPRESRKTWNLASVGIPVLA